MKLTVLTEGWVDWFTGNKPESPKTPSLDLTVDDLPGFVDRVVRDYIRYHEEVQEYPQLLSLFQRVAKATAQKSEVLQMSFPELRTFLNRMLDRLAKDYTNRQERGLIKKK